MELLQSVKFKKFRFFNSH